MIETIDFSPLQIEGLEELTKDTKFYQPVQQMLEVQNKAYALLEERFTFYSSVLEDQKLRTETFSPFGIEVQDKELEWSMYQIEYYMNDGNKRRSNQVEFFNKIKQELSKKEISENRSVLHFVNRFSKGIDSPEEYTKICNTSTQPYLNGSSNDRTLLRNSINQDIVRPVTLQIQVQEYLS